MAATRSGHTNSITTSNITSNNNSNGDRGGGGCELDGSHWGRDCDSVDDVVDYSRNSTPTAARNDTECSLVDSFSGFECFQMTPFVEPQLPFSEDKHAHSLPNTLTECELPLADSLAGHECSPTNAFAEHDRKNFTETGSGCAVFVGGKHEGVITSGDGGEFQDGFSRTEHSSDNNKDFTSCGSDPNSNYNTSISIYINNGSSKNNSNLNSSSVNNRLSSDKTTDSGSDLVNFELGAKATRNYYFQQLDRLDQYLTHQSDDQYHHQQQFDNYGFEHYGENRQDGCFSEETVMSTNEKQNGECLMKHFDEKKCTEVDQCDAVVHSTTRTAFGVTCKENTNDVQDNDHHHDDGSSSLLQHSGNDLYLRNNNSSSSNNIGISGKDTIRSGSDTTYEKSDMLTGNDKLYTGNMCIGNNDAMYCGSEEMYTKQDTISSRSDSVYSGSNMLSANDNLYTGNNIFTEIDATYTGSRSVYSEKDNHSGYRDIYTGSDNIYTGYENIFTGCDNLDDIPEEEDNGQYPDVGWRQSVENESAGDAGSCKVDDTVTCIGNNGFSDRHKTGLSGHHSLEEGASGVKTNDELTVSSCSGFLDVTSYPCGEGSRLDGDGKDADEFDTTGFGAGQERYQNERNRDVTGYDVDTDHSTNESVGAVIGCEPEVVTADFAAGTNSMNGGNGNDYHVRHVTDYRGDIGEGEEYRQDRDAGDVIGYALSVYSDSDDATDGDIRHVTLEEGDGEGITERRTEGEGAGYRIHVDDEPVSYPEQNTTNAATSVDTRCSIEDELSWYPTHQTGAYTYLTTDNNDISNSRDDDEVTGYSVERCIAYTGNTSAASASGEFNSPEKDSSYSESTEDGGYTLFTSICYKDMDYPAIDKRTEPSEECPCTRSNLAKDKKLFGHSDIDTEDASTTDIGTVWMKRDIIQDEIEDKDLPEYVVLGFTGVENIETIKRDVNPIYEPNNNNSVDNRSISEFNRRNLLGSEFSEKEELLKGKDLISAAEPQIHKSHSLNSLNFEGDATPSISFEFEEDAVHEFADCDVAHVACDIIEDGGENNKKASFTEELYCSKSYVEELDEKCAVTKHAANNLAEEIDTRRLTYDEEEINTRSEDSFESYVNIVLPTERKARHFNSDAGNDEGIILESNFSNSEKYNENKVYNVEKEDNTNLYIVDSVDKDLSWRFQEDKMPKSIIETFESRFNINQKPPVLEMTENADHSFIDLKAVNKEDNQNHDQERNKNGEELCRVRRAPHEEICKRLQLANRLSSEQSSNFPQTNTTDELNADCLRRENSSLKINDNPDLQTVMALEFKEEKIRDGQLETTQSFSCSIIENGFHRNWMRPEEADERVKHHENKSIMGEGDNFDMETPGERLTTDSTGSVVRHLAGDYNTTPLSCDTCIDDDEPAAAVEADEGNSDEGNTDETTPQSDCTTVPRIEQIKHEAGVGNPSKAANHEDSDQTPLITSEWPPADNSKDTEDREDSGVWTVDTEFEENLEVDTMPFFKKKSTPKPPKEVTPPPEDSAKDSIPANGSSAPAENAVVSNNTVEPVTSKTGGQEQVPLNTLANVSQKAETATEEKSTKQDAVDGGSDSLPAKAQVIGDTSQAEIKVDEKPNQMGDNGNNPDSSENVVVSEQPTKKAVIESSPLIEKDSKVRDSQPGLLCCTIL